MSTATTTMYPGIFEAPADDGGTATNPNSYSRDQQ